MRLHKAQLEQDDDGRWRAKIDTLPGCDVVANTQGEALVTLKKAAEVHVDFKYVTIRLKVPEQGIHIPKNLIEGVDEVDIDVQGDNRVIATPVIDCEALYEAEGGKKDGKSFADELDGPIDLDEEYPDPRY